MAILSSNRGSERPTKRPTKVPQLSFLWTVPHPLLWVVFESLDPEADKPWIHHSNGERPPLCLVFGDKAVLRCALPSPPGLHKFRSLELPYINLNFRLYSENLTTVVRSEAAEFPFGCSPSAGCHGPHLFLRPRHWSYCPPFFLLPLCAHMRVCLHVCADAHIHTLGQVREQLAGMGSFLPCVFQELNSGTQAWQQGPLPSH